MQSYYSKHKPQKQSQKAQYPSGAYLSWLSYKRLFKIVRYYPTKQMYVNYKLYCLKNGCEPFGSNMCEETAHLKLIEYLKNRLP